MNRKRITLILFVVLMGINIGLLWDGGSDLAADTEWDDTQSDSLLYADRTLDVAAPVLVDGAVPIRPADSLLNRLSASGTIELVSKREIVLEVDGIINQTLVSAGNQVATGELLMSLDETELKRAVGKAEAELQALQAELNKLYEASAATEIAAAEAGLISAQQGLIRAQSGATAEELAAAESKLNAAHAKYAELQSGAGGSEVEEARAEMEKADIARQEAQRAYDKVAWKNDVGMTPEAAQLHRATVEYEKALAKFNRVSGPSSQSDLQGALGEIQDAQHKLEKLRNRPNAAEVAEAQAKVADAEKQLAKLNAGPSASSVQDVQARIQKAQLDLEEAQAKVVKAAIRAPINGTILEVKLNPGQRGTVGTTAIILADTNQLKLTVEVAEVDIPHIVVGQDAEITLDALRDQTFSGIVEHIAPINKSSNQDLVNYPVTIRLTDSSIEGIRPGMNAVATIMEQGEPEKRWLVPQNSVKRQEDGTLSVVVQRGEEFVNITVIVGETMGEWIAVQAPELVSGDAVLGRLASYVDEDSLIETGY